MSNYGYDQMPVVPSEYWPVLEVGEGADFTFDATADVTVNGTVDPIVAASISVRPSGAGEATLSRLSVSSGTLVTVWIASGVPGRVYLYQLVLTTAAGRTLPILIGQVCDPVLAVNPVPPAPVGGFGTPITWP